MDLQSIIAKYKNHSQFLALLRLITNNDKRKIYTSGLKGSATSVLVAALYDAEKFNVLFVLTDKEEAAYFSNDLENLLGEKKIFFFPSSYKKQNDFETLDNNAVLQRAEVLNHISKYKEGNIVVTYTEAVTEKVTTKKSLNENTFDIRRGEKLSIDFLT